MEIATMQPSEAKRAKKQEEDDQDLISALPIHLLQNILSLIPTRDAVRNSTLSRTWLHAWHTLPLFTFKFECDTAKPEETSPLVAKFYNRLSVLHDIEAKFVNFHVSWPSFRNHLYENCDDFDEWLRLVARHRVRELEIDLLPENMEEKEEDEGEDEDEDDEDEEFSETIHDTVFAASESLVVLRLRGCRVMTMDSLWIEIRDLVALRVLFWEDDFWDGKIVEELLTLCPALEECTLISVFQRDSKLMLSDCIKLKQVKLDGFRKVVIEDMPSLQVLDMSNFSYIEGGSNCNEVRSLTLRTCEDTRYDEMKNFVHTLGSLESLVLNTDDTIPITITSPSIENFVFSSSLWPRGIVVYAPTLRCYEYRASVLPLSLIETYPSTLKRIELVLTPEKTETYLFFKNLRRNLPALTAYDSVMMKLTIKAKEFAPHPVPSNEGHLEPPAFINSVELQDIGSTLVCMSLTKWLLWSCRPLRLSVHPSYIFLQVFQAIILHRLDDTEFCEDCCICTCSRLRNVKVETRYGIKDFKNINIDEHCELLSEDILKFRLEWL